jgi:Mg/Co/Ni transporter MgtE
MNEVINNVSKNENITFNNELINEVILHSSNRNSGELKRLIDDLHPADLADLLTFLDSEQ